MRRFPSVTPWCAAVLVVAMLSGGPVPAADEPAAPAAAGIGTVRITVRAEVSPVGDAVADIRLEFRPEDYDRVKALVEDPWRWLQDFAPNRANFQIGPGASAAYDDAAHAVVVRLTELGGTRNRGDGHWEIEIETGTTLSAIAPPDAPRATVTFTGKGTWENDVGYESEFVYVLPAGATNAAFDESTRALSWELPFTGGTGEARIRDPDIKVKDRLMASIYKVYGLGAEFAPQWVAKTVWKNVGTNVARNLRIRYQVVGYSEPSGWDKFPEVLPGQTVVSLYYPVFQAAIAKLRTNSPADLKVEWRWEDAGGKVHEDDSSKRLILLGVNEFVFSNLVQGESFGTWQESFNNAPLLAAWVSRNDPVVKQFAAMANRLAGGLGAGTDDESAARVLRACYDLLRANDFTYQHPPALADKSVSFDPQAVQNVKFPRDVIRDRSGTCIDLAILFAAMANAVGLDPYLALIPGHCFPFVKLPGGNLFAVETTGVGGGIRYGSLDFTRAVEIGNKELADADADGRIHVVSVRDNWTRGISNPELEEFPPDILQKWGLKEELAETAPGPGPGPGPAGLDVLLGLWGGTLSEAKISEEVTLDAMLIGVERNESGVWRAGVRMEFTVRGAGTTAAVILTGIYENGRATDGAVRFPAAKLERTVPATGEKAPIDGNPLALAPSGDGRLVGTLEGEGGFSVTLAPKQDDGPPAPEPSPLDGLLGSWGGNMGALDVGSGVQLDEMYIDVAKSADGAYVATVKMLLTATASGGVKVVIDVNLPNGRVDGDALRFPKANWQRTVPSTGLRDEVDGNPLVLRLTADGKCAGSFEGSDGLNFTLLRR